MQVSVTLDCGLFAVRRWRCSIVRLGAGRGCVCVFKQQMLFNVITVCDHLQFGCLLLFLQAICQSPIFTSDLNLNTFASNIQQKMWEKDGHSNNHRRHQGSTTSFHRKRMIAIGFLFIIFSSILLLHCVDEADAKGLKKLKKLFKMKKLKKLLPYLLMGPKIIIIQK